jgi:hypothetical protein
MDKREMYNASGCKDLTSFQALNNIESEERFKKFLKAIFKLSERYGFHIDNRIAVTDKKTGKKWR